MAIGRADAPFAGTYGAGYFGDLYKTFAGMGLPTTLQGMYTGGYELPRKTRRRVLFCQIRGNA